MYIEQLWWMMEYLVHVWAYMCVVKSIWNKFGSIIWCFVLLWSIWEYIGVILSNLEISCICLSYLWVFGIFLYLLRHLCMVYISLFVYIWGISDCFVHFWATHICDWRYIVLMWSIWTDVDCLCTILDDKSALMSLVWTYWTILDLVELNGSI